MSIERKKLEIGKRVAARTAGRIASENGLKLDANPHPETSELHWLWLDAWCVNESEGKTTPQ